MESKDDVRLIEAGFPCHQVGAETQRERGSSNVMPPVYYLHVWWARRPLIPSRAAVLASFDKADTAPESFIRQLGIERIQAIVNGDPWPLTGKLLERLNASHGSIWLPMDDVVRRELAKEQEARRSTRTLLHKLQSEHDQLRLDPDMLRWDSECRDLLLPDASDRSPLAVEITAGDPAWASQKIAIAKQYKFSFPGDAYQYTRAYANIVDYVSRDAVVLDPTSGGGSIPFEALRTGFRVVANELNPVATTILYATLDYPARFGAKLEREISEWGARLLDHLEHNTADCFADGQKLPEVEIQRFRAKFGRASDALLDVVNREWIQDFLYVRQVTCPHCGGDAPLFNTFWLSKEASDPWGVRVVTGNGKVRFETYRAKNGRGPSGENPNDATVSRGTGQCIHCKQAIDSSEIKRQARGESAHGTWRDRLYCVVAVRMEPKLDRNGRPQRYASGARKGEIKTEKVRYFRPPNERDLLALSNAERKLSENWDRWDAEGLIPTEKFPDGNDMRPVTYGMPRWCDMFTPRQLLGHVTLVEGLRALTPTILNKLGEEQGRAVLTYLQFAIDKGVDYNSRQTRWEFTRGVIKGNFGRHDFSLKWTFGEMTFTGPDSGAAWGLKQASKAYKELAELLEPVHSSTGGCPPIEITNGDAAYMPVIQNNSVDLVCMDPPYYDNVQYAELSDFFYVWQKRTLSTLYPGLFNRRLTDKKSEAVANPARDGSPLSAKASYESRMGDIFRECRRVLKDDGIMTLMFTHKSQDAWETLTRSLIESGWTITACFPVESESSYSMHQKDMAAAASSIYLACRKRETETSGTAVWQGFGGQGVRHDIERAVQTGLEDFAPLKLNPVDEMVASYGKALQVLSSQWPVQHEDEQVSPMMAMNEASRVVAQSRVSRITKGKVQVGDLDSETAMALTILGIWECLDVAYDDILLLSKSLGIALVNKTSSSGSTGYKVTDREIGLNTETGGRASKSEQVHAPLVRKGSKLRLALPEERQPARLANPQTDWDRLHGLIMAYREGDIPVARAYLQEHAAEHSDRIIDLLEVWAAEARHPDRQREARTMLYGLGRQLS
jgi:putative DNA methylase